MNAQSRHKYMLHRSQILMPLFQANNDSHVHERAIGFFTKVFAAYGDNLESTGQANQHGIDEAGDDFNRQPDFGVIAASRIHHISCANLVGEVMFSQQLSDGHRFANCYLTHVPDVCAVILVDVEYPLHIDPVSNRYSVDVQCIYYLYERPLAPLGLGGNITPSAVVSFGRNFLSAADMARIHTITHFEVANIRGYLHTTMIPCNATNSIESIPGHVLLRTRAADNSISVAGVNMLNTALPAEYNMGINLFKLQEAISLPHLFLQLCLYLLLWLHRLFQ